MGVPSRVVLINTRTETFAPVHAGRTPAPPPLLAEPRFATISDSERPRMSDPMLVNRVRHPLRPIAPGAAVNPYLTHTDLSLNPANWFNRRSERRALQKSRDPLTQERILMATRESTLKYEEEIERLKEKLQNAIEHYNKHVERYSEEKAELQKDVGPAIRKAMNYYHGKGAE